MSIDALITEVLAQARGIAEDVQRRTGVRMRTATVEQLEPLLIRYDGEDSVSVVPPRTVVRPRVGDRVVVAKTRGQATILGVLGGTPAPSSWERMTDAPGVKYAGHGFYPSIQRDGDRRYLRGRYALTSGNFTTDMVVATLDPQDWPTQTCGGIGQVSGFAAPTGTARIEISSANGDIRVAPSRETSWVGIDSVTWDVN